MFQVRRKQALRVKRRSYLVEIVVLVLVISRPPAGGLLLRFLLAFFVRPRTLLPEVLQSMGCTVKFESGVQSPKWPNSAKRLHHTHIFVL